jgi:hypothetical protein
VDHAFLGLVPGLVRVYEGHDEGSFRRDRVEVLEEPETVFGVACTAVRQEVFLDGVLAEVTTEWYASDAGGNVWMFGEASVEIEDHVPVPAEDSWQAGVDGAVPWMVLGAEVEVGQVYSGSHPGGREEVTVLALDQSVAVPAGIFEGCLVVVETNPEDEPVDVEDADRIIYAPAVGMVSEDSPGGRIELVSFGPE